ATLHRLFPDGLAPEQKPADEVPAKLRKFALYPRQAPPGAAVFPSDDDLLRNARRDPAVARYVARPPEARRADLLLHHPADVFWTSEYWFRRMPWSRRRPADFTCDFVVHLGAGDAGTTRVEILEYRPRVRVGDTLASAAHGPGIARVWDQRPVPPTTGDREELLAAIRRGLPGG